MFTVCLLSAHFYTNKKGKLDSYPGLSEDDFLSLTDERYKSIRLKRFYVDRGLLIIAIPTAVHEHLHMNLFMEITILIFRMGPEHQWSCEGATTHRAEGRPRGDGGEGDSTGRPALVSRRANRWPTLVIEAGSSRTLESLRIDMRWWFSASDHRVKIYLLVKIEISEGLIIIEKYRESPVQLRPDAVTTRRGASLEPQLEQQIRVTKAATGDVHDPMSYSVLGGPLRLEFNDLFLRSSQTGEEDVTIGLIGLQSYAAKAWSAV